MESNFLISKKGVIYSPLFYFLFLCLGLGLSNNQIYAQKLSNYYTSYNQEDGILYYVFENRDFYNPSDKSDFYYDLTYHSAKDSVSFNFTYFSKEPLNIDKIEFASTNGKIDYPVKKIFIEKDKKAWKHRYSANIPFKEIEEFFNLSAAEINLISAESQNNYQSKTKKWKKQSSIVLDILQMIELNK